MRQIVNEKHIARQTKIGKHAPLAGVALLVVATVLLFLGPEWLGMAMLLVWLGFIASLLTTYLSERYLGPNAHYRKVPEAFKGLDNRYALLVYKTPTPFVLVEPEGLTVLSVSSQPGRAVYNSEKNRWQHQQKMGALLRFMGQEGLGQPHRLAEAEVKSLRQWLAKHIPGGGDLPVRAVLLFIHPDVYLEADGSPLPALRSAEVKSWLRGPEARRPKLTEPQAAALAALLEFAAGQDE